MTTQEKLRELLNYIPDSKRKKILSDSKFRSYRIKGYDALKKVPPKALVALLDRSKIENFFQDFCQEVEFDTLGTIYKSKEKLPTLTKENMTGILAFYLRNNFEISELKAKNIDIFDKEDSFTQLRLPLDDALSTPESDLEGSESMTKKYLGYILKQNSYFLNFYPVFVIENNKLVKIDDPYSEFPQKGNIYLYSGPNQKIHSEDLFVENQAAILEFSQEDLLANLKGDQLNQTEQKLDVNILKNKNHIYQLCSMEIYPVVHSSEKIEFKNKTISIIENNINSEDKVFIESDNILYGPYRVDTKVSPFQIKLPVVASGVITCWKPKEGKVGDNYIQFANDYTSNIICLSDFKQERIDVKSDEELLKDFIRSINRSSALSAKKISENSVDEYIIDADAFKDVSSEIAEARKQKLLEFVTNNNKLESNLADVAGAMANLIAQHGDDDEFRPLLEEILKSRDLSGRIQSLEIVRDKVEKEQELLDSIQNQIKRETENLEQLKTEKVQVIRDGQIKNEIDELSKKRDELEAEIKDLHKYKNVQDLDFELQYKSRQKTELEDQIKERKDQYTKIERELKNSIEEKIKQTQSISKITDIAFEGMLADKLFQAANSWNEVNRKGEYQRIANVMDSGTFTDESLNVIESVINRVKHYRSAYSDNDIINIFICLTQGFLTVFSGEPGTGKTSICNIVAHILGLTNMQTRSKQQKIELPSEYNIDRYVAVSVERGWTSKRDFIGYYNPLSKQFETANKALCDGLNVLNQEGVNSKYPFIILLDEANLSPMEYYWADFMNICDSDSTVRQISLGKDIQLQIPQTLRFVATINNDHTTEVLSPRLLDRASIIQLPDADFNSEDCMDFTDVEPQTISWHQLQDTFGGALEIDFSTKVKDIYEELRDLFERVKINISPRTEKAIRLYWSAGQRLFKKADDETNPDIVALDYALAQKVLPRINGSGIIYADTLKQLEEKCSMYNLSKCASLLEDILERGENAMNYYQYF